MGNHFGVQHVCARVLMLGVLAATSCLSAFATDETGSMAPVKLVQKPPDIKSIIVSKSKLTLEAYLKAVDEYFPALASALDTQHIASANRLEKQGVFDPLLTDESGYTRMQNTSHVGEPRDVLFNYPKLNTVQFRNTSVSPIQIQPQQRRVTLYRNGRRR